MLGAMADEPKRDLPAEPDPYQAKYMASGALYYDKIRAPRAYHLLFLLPVLVVLGSTAAAAAQGGPREALASLISLPIVALLWLLFSALRVSVTRDEVYVQYGLFGPRIKVRDIESAAAVAYDWKKYGGWGIRYGRDGSVAYNMMGDGGRAVEIAYRKGGKVKKLLIASPDPERLAGAIHKARALAGGSATPLRIAAEAAADADPAREAEAEAEAEAIATEMESKRHA